MTKILFSHKIRNLGGNLKLHKMLKMLEEHWAMSCSKSVLFKLSRHFVSVSFTHNHSNFKVFFRLKFRKNSFQQIHKI